MGTWVAVLVVTSVLLVPASSERDSPVLNLLWLLTTSSGRSAASSTPKVADC